MYRTVSEDDAKAFDADKLRLRRELWEQECGRLKIMAFDRVSRNTSLTSLMLTIDSGVDAEHRDGEAKVVCPMEEILMPIGVVCI
jgi:hypothetical protein